MPAASAAECFHEASRLLQVRQVESALEFFTRAEGLGWSADECGGGRWFCYMLKGDFELAWRESDRISRHGAPDPNRLWSGRTLAGKKVIVRCLHGLGDAIQFIRFAPLLCECAEKVWIEAPGCLVRIFETIPRVGVISWDTPGPAVDWNEHIEVMELPRYFRVTAATVPQEAPYLFPPARPAHIESERLKVGIVWNSSNWGTWRSIPLESLDPIMYHPACSFYSLQNDDRDVNINGGRVPQRIVPDTADVMDTASLITELDLVISVDTMVAHLAGALGKPVWLLLAHLADWRWMLTRCDSPWYPSMRIFRQREDRDWSPVVRELSAALENFVSFTRNGKPSAREMVAKRE